MIPGFYWIPWNFQGFTWIFRDLDGKFGNTSLEMFELSFSILINQISTTSASTFLFSFHPLIFDFQSGMEILEAVRGRFGHPLAELILGKC